MAKIHFTSQLQRFLAVPALDVPGTSLGEVLAAAFVETPGLQGYLLDDQGALRRHVAVFVNGQAVRDRVRLSDPVGADDEIYVLQALTGG